MVHRITFEIESDYNRTEIEDRVLKLIQSVAIDPTKCRIISEDKIINDVVDIFKTIDCKDLCFADEEDIDDF